MYCFYCSKKTNTQYINTDMFITCDIKHRFFQQNKQILRLYILTVREFLQLLRSPFDIGRSAVMHTW